jgi:predicted metal-dependent RNase
MPSSSGDDEQVATGSRPTSRIAAEGERMTANKDKQVRRLARKRKAQRRTPSSGQQVLLHRVRASQHVPNTQVIVNPVGTEKMSEVILRFAEPLKDHNGLVSRAMLEIAMIIWNASFMPKAMQRKALEDVVNVLPQDASEARRELFFMVNMLVERKRQYFSSHKRMIMDYHITESAHSIHLDVVSTVPEGYNPA